jgi:hypothetical protein
MTTGPSPRDSGRTAAKGLATLALLKAHFDSGKDHIEMFVPFLLDAINAHLSGDFALEDIRSLVETRHGLRIPAPPLRTILSRAVKHGSLRRDGGRYFRDAAFPKSADLTAARAATEAENRRLAGSLVEFATANGIAIGTEENALALVLEFLSRNHVGLILEAEPSAEATDLLGSRDGLTNRLQRLVARFVTEEVSRNPDLAAALQRMLEGFILQNALLLRDIGSATRRFSRLTVYFDTGFLLEALGLTGEAAGLAAREALDLLRETGAELAVFDKTVMEIRRVLRVYEDHLATSEGIATLYRTSVARYVLTRRLSPSDMREAVSLLESNLRGLGLAIRRIPPHDPRYTLDEARLTELIKRPSESDLDARVVHDVDCIAAVLTLRAGHSCPTYDDARAVFATTTGLLVTHVREWYAACGESGVSPVIHQLALSNIAWLKKPAAASRLKLHELVALCAAALMPARRVWDLFTKHLRNLRESGRLSSDEMVAIVASELTDSLLARFDDDVDPDAQTISEVVERVRGHYQADAQQSIREAEERFAGQLSAEAEARRTAEENAQRREEDLRKVTLRLQARARRRARWLSWAVFGVLGGVAVAGSSASVPELLGSHTPPARLAGYVISAFVWILGVFGLLWGGYLFQWQRRLEDWLERPLRKSLLRDFDGALLVEGDAAQRPGADGAR